MVKASYVKNPPSAQQKTQFHLTEVEKRESSSELVLVQNYVIIGTALFVQLAQWYWVAATPIGQEELDNHLVEGIYTALQNSG